MEKGVCWEKSSWPTVQSVSICYKSTPPRSGAVSHLRQAKSSRIRLLKTRSCAESSPGTFMAGPCPDSSSADDADADAKCPCSANSKAKNPSMDVPHVQVDADIDGDDDACLMLVLMLTLIHKSLYNDKIHCIDRAVRKLQAISGLAKWLMVSKCPRTMDLSFGIFATRLCS
eukprot:950900-Pleurochrysis_carterae.AAC.18